MADSDLVDGCSLIGGRRAVQASVTLTWLCGTDEFDHERWKLEAGFLEQEEGVIQRLLLLG